MTNQPFLNEHPGCVGYKDLPDGRTIAIYPRTFGAARMLVGRGWEYADDQWCYASIPEALVAMAAWDGEGEPIGWNRHPATGRRRPDANPAKEFVRE